MPDTARRSPHPQGHQRHQRNLTAHCRPKSSDCIIHQPVEEIEKVAVTRYEAMRMHGRVVQKSFFPKRRGKEIPKNTCSLRKQRRFYTEISFSYVCCFMYIKIMLCVAACALQHLLQTINQVQVIEIYSSECLTSTQIQ